MMKNKFLFKSCFIWAALSVTIFTTINIGNNIEYFFFSKLLSNTNKLMLFYSMPGLIISFIIFTFKKKYNNFFTSINFPIVLFLIYSLFLQISNLNIQDQRLSIIERLIVFVVSITALIYLLKPSLKK